MLPLPFRLHALASLPASRRILLPAFRYLAGAGNGGLALQSQSIFRRVFVRQVWAAVRRTRDQTLEAVRRQK